MRLTLRTLLAYMDEILEPADREELAKKIESSDFAHDLIHRTKDTVRRLRLSAPQVVGTGMGLDPNTVAEYLDNVLPPDSVADFERICLESDVHLAEVASAHHVLTMVLGEPADVDAAARGRMYSLPAEAERRKHLRIEPAHTAPGQDYAAVTPSPHVFPPTGAAPAAHPHPHHGEIPDYLRATSWTRHGGLLIACATVLLLAVTWLLVSGLGNWFGGKVQVAGGPDLAVTEDAPPPVEPSSEEPSQPQPLSDEASTVTEAVPETGELATPLIAPPPPLQLPPMSTATSAAEPPSPPAQPENPPEVVGVDASAYYPDNPAASDTNAGTAPAPNDLASSTPMPPTATDLAPMGRQPQTSAPGRKRTGTNLRSLPKCPPNPPSWAPIWTAKTYCCGSIRKPASGSA